MEKQSSQNTIICENDSQTSNQTIVYDIETQESEFECKKKK